MKGRRVFSAKEMEHIKELVKQKEGATSGQQKTIRGKIRRIGFYFSDFSSSTNGYTVKDFEGLISSGRIKIEDGSSSYQCSESNHDSIKSNLKSLSDLDNILEAFKKNAFDPNTDSGNYIPDAPGNYIMCLKYDSILPKTIISPQYKEFNNLKVIYTGLAGRSLRKRDFRAHFQGNNAGRSTLRKSLGVLFGYPLIPRDADPKTGKTKFCPEDEEELTKWMCSNLEMYFYGNHSYAILEEKLIERFNPPLNLDGNGSDTNKEFRRLLSQLRNKKFN